MNKRTTNNILKSLKKGQSLREIGDRLGLDNKAVWRIGAANGVYSIRSERTKK